MHLETELECKIAMDKLSGTILKGKQIVVKESFQRKKADEQFFERRRFDH